VAYRHGTHEAAQADLDFLYSERGQELAAKHHHRPRLESVTARCRDKFPTIEPVTVSRVFGGWQNAQKTHFDDGGVFDQVHRP
jgi:sulfate transport system substrate-binding protein